MSAGRELLTRGAALPAAPLVVPVYYDFASTLCYVAHRLLERMAVPLADLGLQFDWHPIDLSKITGWRRGALVSGERRANALRVADELGVALRMPAHWLDSRAALAVALALRGTNKELTWRERVWCAIFEEGRAIDAPGEVESLAAEVGMEVTVVDLDRPDRLDHETAQAQALGVTGVPTFLLGEWPLGGIQDEATMMSLLTRFVTRQRQGPT